MVDFLTTLLLGVLSGAVGGLLSLLGSSITSRRAARAQIQTAAISAFVMAKLNAYADFETAVGQWSIDPNDKTATSAVIRAANLVAVVANTNVTEALAPVENMLLRCNGTMSPEEFASFSSARLELLRRMHNDLLAFPDLKAADQVVRDHSQEYQRDMNRDNNDPDRLK